MAQRTINIKILPDGRTCVHWFYECENGPIKLQGHSQLRGLHGKSKEVSGMIVCNPKQNSVNPRVINGVSLLCMRSDDIRAVTCSACLASDLAQDILGKSPASRVLLAIDKNVEK